MKSLLAALPMAFMPLKDLSHLNAQSVTVSGLSSGAMMAAQMLVTDSTKIQGAGIVAGAPFDCAEGSLLQAYQCMDHPEQTDLAHLLEVTQNLARTRQIDPLVNLKNRYLYVFHGRKDSVVQPLSGQNTLNYFLSFMDASHIKTEFGLNADHGFPTPDRGHQCDVADTPWINNCNYDTAKNVLEQVLQRKLTPGTQKKENLFKLDITGRLQVGATMNTTAIAYVPADCRNAGARCDLHVVFHGCRQTLDEAGWDFILQSGYNDWAENNKIVILYPNIVKSFFNPKGCWDWWGYTGPEYNTKNSPQIRSIINLIKTLTR
jgi:poly(3-hydroxybutyrate) depolymerase